jgi:hypothetical protein
MKIASFLAFSIKESLTWKDGRNFSVRFGSDICIDVKVSVITISASLTADFGSVVKSTTVYFEDFFTTSGFGSKPFGVAITI